MGELLLKKCNWMTFDQEWIDLEYFKEIILDVYEDSSKNHDAPRFDDLRENQFIHEEIMMPIVSYYTFGCQQEWNYLAPGKDADRFFEIYEDTYCEVENDIFGMLYEHRLFFRHYDEEYINEPLVTVW